jgi:hypothetical protein
MDSIENQEEMDASFPPDMTPDNVITFCAIKDQVKECLNIGPT